MTFAKKHFVLCLRWVKTHTSANYLQPKQLPGATALTAASYEATHTEYKD